MSTTIKNVMIVGAGGNLGPSILSALDASNQFNLSILTRNSSKSTFPSHIKVHKIDDSYPDVELEAAFKGQDAIVSTVGSPGKKRQTNMIDAAVKAGVKRFIPAEFGSNSANPGAVEAIPFIMDDKAKVVKYLKTKEKDGMTWSALCTGPFFDWCLKVGLLGFKLSTQSATLYSGGTTKYSSTNLSAVGTAVVNILLKPSETANRYLYICTSTASQLDLLAALEKATGGQKWTVEHQDVEELGKMGREMLSKGNMAGAGPCIIATVHTPGLGGNFEEDVQLDNELLGVESVGLDESVRRVLKEVGGGA
ncbi:MAG: hypothetical protein MMC33_002908 [Icmadophila ericetorum]|nr:hypothetical protein [Icmadophila ericetorum]